MKAQQDIQGKRTKTPTVLQMGKMAERLKTKFNCSCSIDIVLFAYAWEPKVKLGFVLYINSKSELYRFDSWQECQNTYYLLLEEEIK